MDSMKTQVQAESQSTNQGNGRTPKRILVVDDEKDVELLFRLRFRREIRNGTLIFDFALSGQEAFDFLKTRGTENITLLLSDINMPGMSGLELLRLLKDKYPDLPVFMITAYGDDENYRRAQEYGCDGYMTKPLDFDELRTGVFEM